MSSSPTPPLFVKYVASNVKGGVSCLLSPRTVIVGPNGSGKSAVINTLELALGGFASDIVGREEIKKESDLYALAPGREGHLYARAVLSDGSEAMWEAGKKGAKKAHHQYPKTVDPERVFPLRPVRDAVKGNVETARKFFIGHATPGLSMEDVLSRLPKELHEHFRTATLATTLNTPPVDKLLHALEHAKKQGASGKRKGKAQDEVATVVATGLQPLPTEAQQTALNTEAKTAQAELERIVAARSGLEHRRKLEEQAEPLRQQVQSAETTLGQLRAQHATLLAERDALPKPAFMDEHAHRVIQLVKRNAEAERAEGRQVQCACCKNVPEAGFWQQREQQAQAFIIGEGQKSRAYDAAQNNVIKCEQSIAQWETYKTQVETQLNAVNNAIAAGGAATVPSDAEEAAARTRVKAATDELTRIATLKAQWESAKKANDTAKDAAKQGDKWSELHDACVKVVGELLDAGILRFKSQVQLYLPKGDTFGLDLRDGSKQVFRFGLERDGVLHTALSGAEWARTMGALGSACTMPGLLSVIIPEERAFDPLSLAETMQAMGNSPGQVIIASPVMPQLVPHGWTVVDTNSGTHRSGTLDAPVQNVA